MRLLISRVMTLVLAAFVAGAPLASNAATTAVVTGVVQASSGAPLAGAQVDLNGPTHLRKITDARGTFTFPEVPTGLYSLQVAKPGYNVYRDDEVAVFIGETATVNVTLAEASFSSLKTIASVSTSQAGVAHINASSAAINSISAQTFENQGAQQVTAVLDQLPGVFLTPYNPNNGNPNNGASPGSVQTPQIRGALPYETESLIDGHPVSVGSQGTFSPTLINPFLLQDVELVKGPGSMPVEINYAVNGTLNYRTLDPTKDNRFSGTIGADKWGGISTGFKLTGSTSTSKIGYAFGYVTDGAPGPLANFRYSASALPLFGAAGLSVSPTGNLSVYNVNAGQGQQVIGGLPLGQGGPPAAWAPYGISQTFAEPVVGCCFESDTGYHSTSELAKLIFNFSKSTSLKLSYLGGQSVVGNGDSSGTYTTDNVAGTGLPFMYFAPCGSTAGAGNCVNGLTGAPYSGPMYNCSSAGPACGSAIPFDLSAVNGMGFSRTQQNLFQGEFRTALGQTGTVLARYYTGSLNNYTPEGAPAGQTLNYTMRTWGALPLCPVGDTYYNVATGCSSGAQPTLTTFNGQSVAFSAVSQAASVSSNDSMKGETLEVQEFLGNNTVTLAYDRSEQASSALTDEPSVGLTSRSPAMGSNQTFTTFSLRDTVTIKPKLLLDLGDYAINYKSHYSPDGGLTWGDSSHSYNEPRAALTWHPNADSAYRLAAGGSIAPPYIGLMSGDALPSSWSYVIGGVPSLGFILNTNNGQINPETAFGYDLGFDHRIARATSVSADLYFTQVHNLFLPETELLTTAQATAYGCPGAGTSPCYITQQANLGQARYEGIELAVDHAPQFGFGWKVQGSLQRAYTYNLPQYFYCANPGPGCTNDINLAVIPNVNFGGQPTALLLGASGIGGGRVPYAGGYGELNWTGRHGQYYGLGATYFGNNNAFNEPPFFVLSGSARVKLGDHGTRLQLSADNIAGAYANPYPGFFNGIPLPLVNGAQGPSGPIYFAPTPAGNYGPTAFRFIILQNF